MVRDFGQFGQRMGEDLKQQTTPAGAQKETPASN
jgi:hypothetical protein